uniref:Uncharacterized protein n=1 Tax=Homalodisca liturata TaxID=320908 RepID=A0A1B6H518_9HEMI
MKLVLAAVVATCLLGICRSGPIPVPGYGSCSSSCSRCNDEYGDYDTDSSCSPSCSCNDGCGNSNTDSSCGWASCEDNSAPYSYWDLLKMINGNAAGLAALLKNNINNHNFLALTNMLSHNDKGVTVNALNADCDKDAVINNLFTIIKAIASQNKCRRGCSCGSTCCRCRKCLH